MKVEVDRHMVCDTGGERVMECLACLDQGIVLFSREVEIKDRVCIRFLNKGVESVIRRWDRKAKTLVIINSREFTIFKSCRPL